MTCQSCLYILEKICCMVHQCLLFRVHLILGPLVDSTSIALWFNLKVILKSVTVHTCASLVANLRFEFHQSIALALIHGCIPAVSFDDWKQPYQPTMHIFLCTNLQEVLMQLLQGHSLAEKFGAMTNQSHCSENVDTIEMPPSLLLWTSTTARSHIQCIQHCV